MSPFFSAYQKLNEQQKEAVDTIQGPLMIVAGPGTGKTQVLTLRMGRILQETDTPPDAILALTFTEAAAQSMKRRLYELIGAAAYRIHISTFHGFCNEIILQNPEAFPHIIGSQPIAEMEQVRILASCIDALDMEFLKPFGDPHFYVRPALHAINTLKREGVSPQEFLDRVTTAADSYERRDDIRHTSGPHAGKIKSIHETALKRIAKNKELARVYEAYQQELRSQKSYDYADMIMEVATALEKRHDLLQSLQERFLYILVDEHQDTNNAQNKVLELLCSYDDAPNICIVGDEKQAIYRFQGASLQNFLYFKDMYPDAKIIVLEKNYRSMQGILDAAHGVGVRIAQNPVRLISHTAHSDGIGVDIVSYPSQDDEWKNIARHIAHRIAEGVLPHDIAVLYRDNKDADGFARALEREGVAYLIESQRDFIADHDIEKLMVMMRAVCAPGDDTLMGRLLHIDVWGIDPLDAYKIIRTASEHRMTIADTIGDEALLASAAVHDIPALHRVVSLLHDWSARAHYDPCGNVVEDMVHQSGLMHALLAHPHSAEKLEKIRAVFDMVTQAAQAHPSFSLADFVAYLDDAAAHRVPLHATGNNALEGRVRLMTAHRSKGLEFRYVYIVQAYDGHWGNKRMPDPLALIPDVFALGSRAIAEGDAHDDERRLFYVALTRAKEHVVISYARTSAEGKEQLPCEYIGDLDAAHTTVIDGDAAEASEQEHHEEEKTYTVHDAAYVQELFASQEFSVTALNNYLECPWKYFYTNLLRLPAIPNKFQLYGTAVHAALREASTEHLDEKHTIDAFEHALEKLPLNSKDFSDLKEKGAHALEAYYHAGFLSYDGDVRCEVPLKGGVHDGVALTGKLDRIEFIDPHIVRVIDYKTGKPKTRNDIEGKTKNGNGDYKRQLVFYKILLDAYREGAWRMQEAVIDFIEPDERGKHHREVFTITDADVAELKETLSRVFEEIRTGTFASKGCGKKECEFCALRSLMH